SEMAEGNGLTLSLERTFSAPREVVYRALTEPDEVAKWWGPKGFTSPSVDFDPQVGGSYRIAMQPPDGELFHLSGEFREVGPPSRLGYTFRWDPPNPDDRETVATLELEALGDETRVVLTHGEFSTEERLSLHEGGWTDSFDRLGQLFGSD
ncbi:MAG: SRPBCC domain-containing protein, partial [Solirubrobacterales bacterium]